MNLIVQQVLCAAEFTQMCITTIANLMQASTKEGTMRQYFSRDREIVPYIDSHWEYMTTMPRRVTQSWHATVQKTLLKEKGNHLTLIIYHLYFAIFELFIRFELL